MPRPTSKKELLDLSIKKFEALIATVNAYSEEERNAEFPKGTMNCNCKDVLAHIHHWHLMMLSWHKEGMAGEKPAMPAEGYTWKTVPQLNRSIWEKYHDIELTVIQKEIKKSFLAVQKVIKTHSNQELFEKKKYKWTGTTSMGAYFISATSSHYDWALKLIKKAKKKSSKK